ncbi:unnamed protein product [Meganyctiphanes norvegica]|uniref:Oplophorus-luciferin 2-monooxygenase non-catalytic subunit n=1 Tax=Meganyctiphanes norvegica TaxID=48144 RepID=A0AAV2RZU9_MEGNR
MSSLSNFIIPLCILTLVSRNLGVNILKGLEKTQENGPCPDASVILPCICTHNNDDNSTDIDCSGVTSENELKKIFNSTLPTKNFGKFIIMYNKHLKVLESGVFNGITFEEFFISNNEIEKVENGAFNDSFATAYMMVLLGNKIQHFPFSTLHKFANLTYLNLNFNPLGSIPSDGFQGITTLKMVSIMGAVKKIAVGTFKNLTNVEKIYAAENSLRKVPSGLFVTGSDRIIYTIINNNNISSVEPNAFDPVEGLVINMDQNSMLLIAEDVWKNLLEAGVTLYLGKNPLKCGCDIAWLVRNATLLSQISDNTQCSNGKNIHDLDPHDYIHC